MVSIHFTTTALRKRLSKRQLLLILFFNALLEDGDFYFEVFFTLSHVTALFE